MHPRQARGSIGKEQCGSCHVRECHTYKRVQRNCPIRAQPAIYTHFKANGWSVKNPIRKKNSSCRFPQIIAKFLI